MRSRRRSSSPSTSSRCVSFTTRSSGGSEPGRAEEGEMILEYDAEVLNDLSDYFYGAPIALNITGPDGTISRTNIAELKMLGYSEHEGEYVGHHIAEFHADPDQVHGLLDRL